VIRSFPPVVWSSNTAGWSSVFYDAKGELLDHVDAAGDDGDKRHGLVEQVANVWQSSRLMGMAAHRAQERIDLEVRRLRDLTQAAVC
jgi:hypothetical protein